MIVPSINCRGRVDPVCDLVVMIQTGCAHGEETSMLEKERSWGMKMRKVVGLKWNELGWG